MTQQRKTMTTEERRRRARSDARAMNEAYRKGKLDIRHPKKSK